MENNRVLKTSPLKIYIPNAEFVDHFSPLSNPGLANRCGEVGCLSLWLFCKIQGNEPIVTTTTSTSLNEVFFAHKRKRTYDPDSFVVVADQSVGMYVLYYSVYTLTIHRACRGMRNDLWDCCLPSAASKARLLLLFVVVVGPSAVGAKIKWEKISTCYWHHNVHHPLHSGWTYQEC